MRRTDPEGPERPQTAGSGLGTLCVSLLTFSLICASNSSEATIWDYQNSDSQNFGLWHKARKSWKLMMLEGSQHPQTSELCGKRSIDIIFGSRKNVFFSQKIFFRNIFFRLLTFSTPQDCEFRDFDDPVHNRVVSMILVLLGPRKSWNRRCWSVPSTPKPKNYAGNEVLALLFFPEKMWFFLQKLFFRNISPIFLPPRVNDFRDLADPAMCPSIFLPLPLAELWMWNIAGKCENTWKIHWNQKILKDFEKFENFRKNIFWVPEHVETWFFMVTTDFHGFGWFLVIWGESSNIPHLRSWKNRVCPDG